MKIRTLALTLALVAAPTVLFADEDLVKERLGEAYGKASPTDKLVMIALGHSDKVWKDYKEKQRVQAELDRVVLEEVKKGKDSTERLAILGKLRADASAKIKDLSAERRKEKKPYVSFHEPSSQMQRALAASYVIDTAGPSPSVEKLACLKTVRDSTAWTAHTNLILAYATDAFARDEAYGKADHAGKLGAIKKLAADAGALGDQERKYLEQSVLADWISTEIKGGKSPGDLLIEVDKLKKAGTICFFASSWASDVLKGLADVR